MTGSRRRMRSPRVQAAASEEGAASSGAAGASMETSTHAAGLASTLSSVSSSDSLIGGRTVNPIAARGDGGGGAAHAAAAGSSLGNADGSAGSRDEAGARATGKAAGAAASAASNGAPPRAPAYTVGDGFACYAAAAAAKKDKGAHAGAPECGCDAASTATLLEHSHWAVRAGAVAAVGMLFGLGLQKSGMYRAELIRGQLLFRNNLMLQTFLAAAATSTGVLTCLYYSRRGAHIVGVKGGEHHSTPRGFAATMLGCALVGIGMAVAGVCPGTVYAAVGSGSAESLLTLAGGVVGSFAYGALLSDSKAWRAFSKWGVPSGRARTAFTLLGTSRGAVAPVLCALMLAGSVGASYLPVHPSLPFPPAGVPQGSNPLTAYVWSPQVAGALIGSLQLPLTLLVGRNLGCATAFSVPAAAVAHALGLHNKFFESHRPSAARRDGVHWQVPFVLGATAGAALGTWASVSALSGVVPGGHLVGWYPEPQGVSPLASFLGGAVAMLGARMGGGCTSGQGITGVGHMSLASFAGVAAMFGAGAAVAFAAYA